jgi:hypothetical protein
VARARVRAARKRSWTSVLTDLLDIMSPGWQPTVNTLPTKSIWAEHVAYRKSVSAARTTKHSDSHVGNYHNGHTCDGAPNRK